MLRRCNQCGYSKNENKDKYKCVLDFDSSEDSDSETEGYFCECIDSCEPIFITSLTLEQKNYLSNSQLEQNINLAKMQLGRIAAFKTQDIGKGNFDVTFDLDGKLLFAHAFIFTAVSSPMEAMISERWSNKDDIIKIETYTYDEFFQLLTFLYSGTCEITQDNISRLIDMAEFFDVTVMKEHCDKYLSKMIQTIDIENVGEVLEMAEKYSLAKSIEAIYKFIRQNRQKIITSDAFVKFKRPFIDVLLSVPKNAYHEQQLFLSVFKWAEHQVSVKETILDGTDFLNALKAELNEVKSKFDFSKISFDFVIKSFASKDIFYSTSDFCNFLGECCLEKRDEEKYFKTIYELVEKEALIEQTTSIDENFNLQNVIERKLNELNPIVKFDNMSFQFVKEFIIEKAFLFYSKELYEIIAECQRTDEEEREVFEMLYQLAEKNVEYQNLPGEVADITKAIKAELAESLPKIKFYKMDENYLIDFAAQTGFISRQQAIDCSYINVEIRSGRKVLHGNFKDVVKLLNFKPISRLRDISQTDSGWTYHTAHSSYKNKLRFTYLRFKIPQSSSPVEEMRGVDWYFLLEKDGILTVKHRKLIKSDDYFIAELRGSSDFQFVSHESASLTVSCNNIF